MIRGVLLDKAQGFINGTIRMEPKCLGADGRLEEKILLLSPTARIEAEPNLEIRCHEVMASHAASVERIDEEKLFYLASRGIAGEVAIPLIVEGFLGEALGDLVDQSLKKRMNEIVFKGGVVN
ncbi:MAG: iron-sulfur (Fe-S) cluster assembly protein, Fe-S cluster assembly protein SufD [Candidatus Peregrinibacteria bacterium GW2011_GWE2_39_6]|nr:MAG: iron-sulfur (Fe-S) cluster assembly protein, Fe-S cluster assembly protein SufD [Candidatus Peregrinibacteria bacterium GW2011_GWE2_39_6]